MENMSTTKPRVWRNDIKVGKDRFLSRHPCMFDASSAGIPVFQQFAFNFHLSVFAPASRVEGQKTKQKTTVQL